MAVDTNTQNTSGNSTSIDEFYSEAYVYLEILMTLVAIIALISNLVIIYSTFKYHILQTRTYFYVRSWCICNFLIAISMPVMMNLMGIGEDFSKKEHCIWSENKYVVLFGNLVFVAVLIIDCYIRLEDCETEKFKHCCGKEHARVLAGVFFFHLLVAEYDATDDF
ncbi:hypothetical protein JTB14_001012 [Gonioctena quinquepunctata]|nr:hypothetical protein JTB14_001012 [Gonioctena quinquepunctata]